MQKGVVEMNVPIPLGKTYRGVGKVVLSDMPPGGSKAFEMSQRNTLSATIGREKTRLPGSDFTTRVMLDDKGEKYIRVWRTV